MREPKKILIVRTDRMGDVILSTPVISAVRRRYPDSHIAFMCRPYTRDLVLGNPDLDEVIVYDKYKKHKSFLGTASFIGQLACKHFDMAIILHPTNRVHLVCFFAGIKQRIGWDRRNSFLLTKRVVHRKQEGTKHESQYTLDLLAAIGIETPSIKPFIPVNAIAHREVTDILNEKGINIQSRFIVVHPSASCISKRWPQKHFIRLIHKIKEVLQIPVIVVTSESEKHYAREIIESCDVVDLRGAVELIKLIALIGEATLFISNDSGPVHIAAALEVPVISIFGRRDPGLSPERWKPLGENSVFIHKDVGCPICLAHNCERGFLCLESITPDEVFVLVEKILAKN